jgi:predicted permease
VAIIGEWIRRLGYLVRRRAREDELRREMEAHRALMAEPRAFGNTLRLREEARDAWGWTWLDDFVQDTRFALRTLRRSPGFALTAVVTLALGIGVNIAMFSVVNGLLLRPLYERPDEVVGVYGRSTAPSGEHRGISYPNYLDLREGTVDVFANLAAYSTLFAGVDLGEGARRTLASAVTANYFQIFGRPLALGRPFTADEERLGADIRVAIISFPIWERRGADPGMLGRSVRVNGEQFTVVGVAPEGFTGASIPGPEVWLPIGAHDTFRTAGVSAGLPSGAREAHEFAVVGRLRAGTSIEAAAPALTTVARRLEQAFPAVNSGYTLEMSPPSRLMFMPGPGGGALAASLALLLMVMPAIVLLVACLNLVDLLLARGHVRGREIAIRSSLGAGRARLTRQLITEGLLLALAGGAVGLLLSIWATSALLAGMRPVLPVDLSLPELDLDWRVLAGTVGFSLAATLLFGAWPARALTARAAATDLTRHVREDGRPRSGRIGNALVIGQVALSLLLLASGGLFLMSAISAATADPGFRLDGGVLVEVDPSLAGYDEARGRRVHRALVDRLRTVPGVEAVTIGSSFPFSGFGDSRQVAPAGAADALSRSVGANFMSVGRDYARVLGLPILGGRDFSDAELAPGSSERVAIIDDMLAQRLWPGEEAVGRLIQFLDAEGPEVGQPIRVVGMVPAVKHSLGNPRPAPHVYVPLGQHYQSAMTLQLRIADEDAERAMLATVARVVRDVDERLPLLRLETWRDHLDASLDIWLYRTGARVFAAFAGIALLLAVIGVYGVKSYIVSRRTREFGIRIAIGAHPHAVLWQVLREGGRVTAVGIGIGLLLALGAGQLLQGFLYGVDAFEPVVMVMAALILVASSLLASYIPALRATKVDPTVALRSE